MTATATRQTCGDCGTRYEGEQWQRYCWRCWRARKGQDAQEDAYHRGYMDALDAVAQDRPAGGLAADLLRRVVLLCHPDKHPPERFAEANAVTCALLELRKAVA